MALPRMATRYRLLRAFAGLGDAPDGVDVLALCSAAIGLCWDGPGGPPVTLEQHRRDVLRYGEDVLDWLVTQQRRTVAQIVAEGRPLLDAVAESLPREEAVQAAADPSEGTGGTSTSSSSASASSGSEIPSTSTG